MYSKKFSKRAYCICKQPQAPPMIQFSIAQFQIPCDFHAATRIQPRHRTLQISSFGGQSLQQCNSCTNHCIAYSKFIPILRSLNAQHRIYDPLHSMHQTRRELHTIGSVQSIHSSLVVYRCAQHTIANIKPSSVERARHQSTKEKDFCFSKTLHSVYHPISSGVHVTVKGCILW